MILPSTSVFFPAGFRTMMGHATCAGLHTISAHGGVMDMRYTRIEFCQRLRISAFSLFESITRNVMRYNIYIYIIKLSTCSVLQCYRYQT